jgi:adenosylhomocysteine nucleosidase
LKILVTFALENEFAPWRAAHNFQKAIWGEVETFVTEIGGAEVGVALTGVGARQARLGFPRGTWGESESLAFCVSSGLAGALKPEYRIGQVLAARTVMAETPRTDAESTGMESSAPLISFASECGATLVDRFYTAEHVVAKAEEKRHLGLTADAVEMESFETLRAAAEGGIPAIAIRAISDVSDEDLPLDMSDILTDEGQVSFPRVLGQVALHPGAVPGLVKLGKQSKIAAESLARFLDQYVGRVALQANNLESKAVAAPSSGTFSGR